MLATPGPSPPRPTHSEKRYPAGPFAEISYRRLNPLITGLEPSIIVLWPNKLNDLPRLAGIGENSAPGQFFR